MAAIYSLRSPRSAAVRYVGYAADPAARLRRHLWEAARGSRRQRVHIWLGALLARGLLPILEQLELVESGDPDDREAHWIGLYRALSHRLLNVADGKLPAVSAAGRRRAGDKLRGRTLSDEARARISAGKLAAKTKRPDAAAIGRRAAEANRGRKMTLSDAERDRRRTSLAAVTHLSVLSRSTPEARAKQSDRMRLWWAARRPQQ